MQKFIIAAIFILMITGCATQIVPTEQAVDVPSERIVDASLFHRLPQTVPVIVKRDSGFGGSACTSRIYVNGKPVVDIHTSERIVVYLPEGEHLIGADPGVCGGNLREVRAFVKAGRPLTFRVGYGSNGDYFIDQTSF